MACEVAIPSRALRVFPLSEIWEQLVLPLRSLGRLLVSPANSGPLLKRNQLLIVHDLAPFVGPEWYSRWYRIKARLMVDWLAPRVRLLSTVSETSRRRLSERTRRDDVHVFLNRPSKRRSGASSGTPNSGTTSPDLFALSIATVEPRKNLATVLRAWEHGRHQYPKATLLCVGTTSTRVFTNSNLDDGIDNVTFVGRLDDTQLGALLDKTAVVITVPIYEGYGRVLVEALLHGRAVVASDIEAHREICNSVPHHEHQVTLVDPADEDAIALALFRALGHPRVWDSAEIEHHFATLDLTEAARFATLVKAASRYQ